MRTIEGIRSYIKDTPLERLCNELHDAFMKDGNFVTIEAEGATSTDAQQSPYSLLVPKKELQKMFDSDDIRESLSNYAEENMHEVKMVFRQCQVLI